MSNTGLAVCVTMQLQVASSRTAASGHSVVPHRRPTQGPRETPPRSRASHTGTVDRTPEAIAHEEGLALFISPEWRTRYRESLDDERRRNKMLSRLHHFSHLDERFAQHLRGGDQNSEFLLPALRRLGAGKRCYVVSNDSDLDRRAMGLDEALAAVVDAGSFMATFISCVPGKLAYFHDEEIGNRHILHRVD
jgi:hypothetical protein